MQIQLLSGATATNSPPTAGSATAGFDLTGMGALGQSHRPERDTTSAIVVKSTAGSGTMTVTLRLWVYSSAISEWMPYGTHATAASKGVLNEANAIGEVNLNSIVHAELVNGLHHFDRVYLEVTAIGGTATAVDAYLIGR